MLTYSNALTVFYSGHSLYKALFMVEKEIIERRDLSPSQGREGDAATAARAGLLYSGPDHSEVNIFA